MGVQREATGTAGPGKVFVCAGVSFCLDGALVSTICALVGLCPIPIDCARLRLRPKVYTDFIDPKALQPRDLPIRNSCTLLLFSNVDAPHNCQGQAQKYIVDTLAQTWTPAREKSSFSSTSLTGVGHDVLRALAYQRGDSTSCSGAAIGRPA
jgi:hypothetical protein